MFSPTRSWEAATSRSGLFVTALEDLDHDERPAHRDEMIETIEGYFDDGRNGVSKEYQLASSSVE